MTDATAPMTDDRRREIFAALVAAQDEGMPVAQSRAQVGEHYGLTAEAVRAIVREGMDNEWPPL